MRLATCVMLVLLLPTCVFADGKVFPRTAVREDVTIPDQQALIHWADGVERLVIQTAFEGAGTNFAWVVPLPSKPIIEAATPGLFPTLRYLFQPELVHAVAPWYASVLFGIGMLYSVLTIRPRQPLTGKTLLAMGAVYGSAFAISTAGGLFVLVLFTCGVIMVLSGNRPVYVILLLTLMGLLLSAMLMPSLGHSKGSAGAQDTSSVDLLDRKTVGSFETLTLAAKDSGELLGWLSANGYEVSTNAATVVADYVDRGWIFVAAKLSRAEARRQTSLVHPLSFTFQSPEPVYPMRLTGVDAKPVSVELYIFGPDTASVKGFKMKHSSKPSFPEPAENWIRTRPADLEIRHPQLREWVKGAPVATRLIATVSPEQMQEDFVIRWKPFRPHKTREYSYRGALTHAANWASVGVLACGLVWAFSTSLNAPGLLRAGRYLMATVPVVGVLLFACVEKVPVKLTSGASFLSRNDLRTLALWLDAEKGLDQSRNDIRLEISARTNHYKNFMVGGKIQEQDSPGNFVIKEENGVVDFLGYDAAGAPHVLNSLSRRKE
jgi:hypothetical protein